LLGQSILKDKNKISSRIIRGLVNLFPKK